MKSLLLFLFFTGLSSAHAQQSCLDIFQKKTALEIEYGHTYEKKTHNRFTVVVVNKGYGFEAFLSPSGRVSIMAYLTAPERGMRSHLRGSDLFKDMIEHFGLHRISVISGIWNEGTNYDIFNTAVANGYSHKKAAAQTWTAQQAAIYGFSKVRSVRIKNNAEDGTPTVIVDFVRPE